MLNLKEYKDGINLLKALAILNVTYYHIWRTLGRKTLEFGGFDLTLPFHFGNLGVNLFVFVAGFLVIPSIVRSGSIKIFMFNKFKALSPLYFLAILFYFIFTVSGFPITSQLHDLNSVLLHLTYTHTLVSSTTYSLSGVLWYMGLIMQLYFFGYLIYKLYLHNKYLSFLVVLILHFLSFHLKGDIIATRFVGKYVLLFFIGMMSYQYFEKITDLFYNKFSFTSFSLALGVFLFSVYSPNLINFKYMLYHQAFVFIFFPFFLVLIKGFKVFNSEALKFVCYLGVISYPLYLFNYSYLIVAKSVKVHGFHALFFYTVFLFVMAVIFYEVNKWMLSKINRKEVN